MERKEAAAAERLGPESMRGGPQQWWWCDGATQPTGVGLERIGLAREGRRRQWRMGARRQRRAAGEWSGVEWSGVEWGGGQRQRAARRGQRDGRREGRNEWRDGNPQRSRTREEASVHIPRIGRWGWMRQLGWLIIAPL
jgi:hypothetical protein